jgi:hypothetical protein
VASGELTALLQWQADGWCSVHCVCENFVVLERVNVSACRSIDPLGIAHDC